MAAPSTDYPALGASTSSSGFTDGLGRRSLAFDREGGTMLERLAVRAELSAFERSLRDRVERIGAMDDERLAKPRSIERAPDGSLFVFSEFVPGTRLSDLLDATAQEGSAPGVDVALGFLLDVLPALCGLHAGAGFAHGAISPGRTVLTPAGQVVLLDGIFGDALAHLQYTRRRLWTEFGIAMPPAAGPPRFDAAGDIAQASLSAVMLVLGRQLSGYDYPDGIPTLLSDVVEVAQIRGSSNFADGLTTFFQRALPLPGRKPYTAADDALIDLRDLARELGLDVCRRALVEFIEGQNGESAAAAADGYAHSYVYDDLLTASTNGDDAEESHEDHGDGEEIELDLGGSRSRRADQDETYYDLSSSDETAVEDAASTSPLDEAPLNRPDFSEFSALTDAPSEPVVASAAERALESVRDADYESRPEDDSVRASQDTSSPFDAASAEPAVDDTTVESESEHDEPASVEEAVEDAKSSRRRKRARSVRSRKDKLQSVARPQKLAPPPPPPPTPPPRPVQAAPPSVTPAPVPVVAAKPTSSGWLVEPSKAASFDPPVPVQPEPPALRPIALAPPPPPPTPVGPAVVAPPLPPPVAIPVPPPARPLTPVVAMPPPIPLHKPVAPTPAVPPGLKLKTEPPSGYTPPRRPRAEPAEDIYSPRAAGPVESDSGGFPWKIASGAVVFLVVALVAGRAYMTSGNGEAERATKAAVTAAPAAAAGPTLLPKTGRIQIETDPAGARVLLDGKHVGDSPVTIEASAGRHTVTLATNTGSVRRTVRVETGKTLTLNVPIFSGWVDVASPIILEVSEDGKLIGTTEQNRLLLRPGRHVLTFTNRDLDYSTVQTVDIEPGEAETLTLNPKGTVNLNATPWAEVWIDGKKVGDTPLANLEVPLGTREIVFKNQGYVEQRVTRTIRANAPLAISVDMTKQ